jgi:hypothetical protein
LIQKQTINKQIPNMKKLFFSTLAVAATCGSTYGLFGFQTNGGQETLPQPAAQEVEKVALAVPAKPSENKTTANQDVVDVNQVMDGKIKFSFKEQEWSEVIPWFADQAGYSLQPIADWPAGTFTLKDTSEYTVLEALDQLNHALLIRSDEPYTLIRNRQMLVLWKTRDTNFPNDLIESIEVADLDKRGKYETISCIFDVGELNANDMYDELKPMISDVHKDYFVAFPAANQLHVRETGGHLREIRDLIKTSQDRKSGDATSIRPYRLKHQDSETFMMLAGPLLGIPEGQTARPDESLSISADVFGERMLVAGTEKMLEKFEKVAAIVDSPVEPIDGSVVLDKPYVKAYPVFTDPKLALNILDTMLEGLDIKMDQDETTGTIMVLAAKEQHAKVAEYLAAISDVENSSFDIITLQNRDPAEVIVILESMFRQNGAEESTTGPVLMAQAELYQILVRGTPQEVLTVRKMVEQLDANSQLVITGPRSKIRMIEMSDSEQGDIMPMLEDLLQINNRSNKIEIILPEDRKDIRSRIRTGPQNAAPSLLDFPQSNSSPAPRRNLNQRGQFQGSQFRQNLNQSMFLIGSAFGVSPTALTSYVAPVQEEVSETSDESQLREFDYKPASQVKSIPGSPIKIRETAYGIVLDSQDLDALDDLERAIYDRLDEEGVAQAPKFFALNYRQADEMLGFLESYYGLGDSGGGGAGGGLMEGMMNNMMGGGAGDLLGGLLGGGTGSETVSTDLEGAVQFGVDMRFNMIFVRGATGNDLEAIAGLIETLDQPDPPHNPELVGGFYTIDINFRDPTELKTIIEQDLSDLLSSGEEAKGGGQNAEAAQMMKMMQSLTGKNKNQGGGSGADLEKQKPKGKLGVDPATRKLLVTGPHFIYKEVLLRVEELDIPGPAPPKMEIMEEIVDLSAHVAILKAVFGDNAILLDATTGEPIDSQNGANGARTNTAKTPTAGSAQQDAMRQMMIKAAQSQQAGRGGQTGRGGGTTRGGGGSGGGTTRGGGGGGGGRGK